MKSTTRGTRSLLALAAAAATAFAGAMSVPTPAQSVPAGDCAVPFPVAELAADQPVTGLTVSKGTTPDGFTGTVLGVLDDGIAPGLDLVMVRLTSSEIDRVGGIWAGMSGSPVYAEDGRLIGAVAYGLSWGPSPVAGVTPFEEMDDYLPAPPAPTTVDVPESAARSIARSSDVTAAQAALGFTQLPLPMSLSGVSSKLAPIKTRGYVKRSMASGGTTSAAAAGAETVVAGGNLAFSATTGEIAIYGLGTATSVCDDAVVGFGHPATFRGEVEAGLSPAEAIYVQEDSIGTSYKVGNVAPAVGTITDDHLTGITGTFGATPPAMPVTSTVTYGARNRTGSTDVLMEQYAATAVFYQLLGNHDRVLDGRIPGTEEHVWTIKGHKPNGDPFQIDMSDRYVDEDVVLYSSIWDIPDMVWILSRMSGVTLDEVTMDSTVIDDTATAKITGAEYKKGTQWVKLTRGTRVDVKAGSTLKLRVTTTDTLDNVEVVKLMVDIPNKASGSRAHLHLQGGGGSSFWRADTVDEMLKIVEGHVRNDQISAWVHNLSGKDYEVTGASDPQSLVVSGSKLFTLRIS